MKVRITGASEMNVYQILRAHWLNQARNAREEYRSGVGSFGAYYSMVKRLANLRARRTPLLALR